MRDDGHLTRLDTAFSRDQADKIYVQDRMMEQAPLFWSWLQDGASVYVCGDASRMAKDVHATLLASSRSRAECTARRPRNMCRYSQGSTIAITAMSIDGLGYK